MDAIGARELRLRIEERQQWQQAEAVRDGRQSREDPDAHRLSRIANGLRVYDSEEAWTIVDGVRVKRALTLAKKLVNGWWEVVTLEAAEPG